MAGGLGTRLRQVVSDVPKSMAPISGRPFLEILLASLNKKGFCRVVISLGYMADKIITYFGSKFSGMELHYEIELTPLGTGGAIRRALTRCKEDHAFVFNGDTFIDLEIENVETTWQRLRIPVIVASVVSNVKRYGQLHIQNGRVISLKEKNTTGPGVINAGCYVFPKNLLDRFPIDQPFSLETDFLVQAVKEQSFHAFISKGRFIDIGIPEEYARAEIELAKEGL